MSLSYSNDYLGSVWYHSEPSEIRGPLFPKPITGQELFFLPFLFEFVYSEGYLQAEKNTGVVVLHLFLEIIYHFSSDHFVKFVLVISQHFNQTTIANVVQSVDSKIHFKNFFYLNFRHLVTLQFQQNHLILSKNIIFRAYFNTLTYLSSMHVRLTIFSTLYA